MSAKNSDNAIPSSAIKTLLAQKGTADEAQRQSLAEFVANSFARNDLSDDENRIAIEILHRFARDTSERVRTALAHCLAHTPILPTDLAQKLAYDVVHVAEPILMHSLSLTDEDLMAIICMDDGQKQTAIAKRSDLSHSVVHSLIERAQEPAVEAVLDNKTARIAGDDARLAAQRFSKSTAVLAAIARRHDLPADLAADIVLHASAGIRALIEDQLDLPTPFIENLVLRVRDEALRGPLGSALGNHLLAILRRLHDRQQITDSLVLRITLLGDKDMLEAAIAVRAGMGLVAARLQLYHRGPQAFADLIQKARFARMLQHILKLALPLLREAEDRKSFDRSRYQTRLSYNLVHNFRTIAPGPPENLIAQILHHAEWQQAKT
ncbi:MULTISPECIES: DUF2336 domain-containing protein [unclassified Iodidimonas]|jgi:uncharacterized protein (DUF2336 family)|uniref:DUF2336 domain-containing protein n=1 Tax=unclassified Iodidimonas TaxID=2626145 RepID=UPI002482B159|nr:MULTISPECIES: DUF2336 domain-containing protein [unclassified Iodidimonas]